MARPLFTVTLTANGTTTVSRFFSTLTAARKWHAWLLTQPYTQGSALYRGPAGGELLAKAGA